jgi:hypothetical protein
MTTEAVAGGAAVDSVSDSVVMGELLGEEEIVG